MSTATRDAYVDKHAIRRELDSSPFDAVIVSSPEAVPYFSGFYNRDLRDLPERFHFVVWPKGGEPCFVVVEKRVRLMPPGGTFINDVRGYQGEGLDSMAVLAEVLREKSLERGRIGIEGRHFPGGHLLALMQKLPTASFEDAKDMVERARLIKTSAEREALERVGELTAGAIEDGLAQTRVGESEREIAARIEYEILSRGAEMLGHTVLGSGERSGLWHALPSSRQVAVGDIIRCDFGGFIDGYPSDTARTVVVGHASDLQREMYQKIAEVKDAVVEYIRPGVRASDVAKFTQRGYEERGLEFKWDIVGHSIGLGLHEPPQIYPWVDETIEAGMVMEIELGYTDIPNDSYHIEDLIVVEPDGAVYATKTTAPRELPVVDS